MTKSSELICITCPKGCSLHVTHEGKAVQKVEGHQCKRGIKHAESEIGDPRRVVTTTVKVRGGLHPLVPVYTGTPVPKLLVFDLLKELRKLELEAPVKAGQVILKDVLGTGVDVIASRDLSSNAKVE